MLNLHDVSVAYGEVLALERISLEVRPGEIVAVLGPNGAGKTTLLRTISGLLKPRKGRITFNEKRIDGRPPHEIARLGAGHVPEGRGILAGLTVMENLRLGAQAARRRDADFERVFDLFPVLKERQRQDAAMLSGGEQQMLAIGRTLLAEPRLLLIDEMSLGLAPKIVRELLQVLAQVARQGSGRQALGLLLVEQNVKQVMRVADRLCVLVNGSLAFAGTPAELATRGDLMDLYLGDD